MIIKAIKTMLGIKNEDRVVVLNAESENKYEIFVNVGDDQLTIEFDGTAREAQSHAVMMYQSMKEKGNQQ